MAKITETVKKTKKIMRHRVLIADAIFIICVITAAAVVLGVR
ncbi:hypothetical protein [Pectinatus frisingensis]|nr:hypothetical protein [Pectinatus frisingensis]